jgi:hypothetical protein
MSNRGDDGKKNRQPDQETQQSQQSFHERTGVRDGWLEKLVSANLLHYIRW